MPIFYPLLGLSVHSASRTMLDAGGGAIIRTLQPSAKFGARVLPDLAL